MFGNTFNTALRQGASKRHGLLSRLSEALDAYAAYRMQMAVPEFEFRRAERTTARYRRQSQQATAH